MKAILRQGENEECLAESYSGKSYILIRKGVKYDFIYSALDDFFLIIDDVLYRETSTAFDFVED